MSLINYWKTRGLLGAGAVVAASIGLFGGRLLGFPAGGVSHPSIMLQPFPLMAALVVGGLLSVSTLVGTLIAGRVRPDAGLFCGLFSLWALSWHSGQMRDVLFAAPASSTYITMAVETGILVVILGLLQLILGLLVKRGLVAGDHARDGMETPSATPGELILAVLASAGFYVLAAWFLVPTDAKQQALLGVGVAGFAAAALVHQVIVPSAPAWPLWIGTMVGAVVSFAYASSAPGVPSIGEIAIPPARALPIDHASAGAAAAILGYWYSRRWKRAAQAEQEAAEAAAM